ncbi:flagellin, partial [Pseudomonas aeruginosa]
AKIDISTAKGAQSAQKVIEDAIKQIDAQRPDLGEVQNRFDNTINNLKNIGENVSAARGRIEDTDFAAETANLTKNQVLQQAGTAILAQA